VLKDNDNKLYFTVVETWGSFCCRFCSTAVVEIRGSFCCRFCSTCTEVVRVLAYATQWRNRFRLRTGTGIGFSGFGSNRHRRFTLRPKPTSKTDDFISNSHHKPTIFTDFRCRFSQFA
jgi:hypothetical protein